MEITQPIKALFFDIDGTLVPFGHHEPPAEVIAALEQLQGAGIKVIIASGRHINWIDNLGELRPDAFVTANGNYCVEADRTTEIYRHIIPPADIDRLIEFAHTSTMPIVAVPAQGEIIINREDANVDAVRRQLNMPATPIRPLDSIRGTEIVQLMAFGSDEERLKSGIFTAALHGCEPTSWNPYFCDIIPRATDKSIGIDRVLDHFGISLTETAAFGDGANDIGMLRHCAQGIAMGNAAADVKAAASYITTSVTDHGILNALRYLFPACMSGESKIKFISAVPLARLGKK